MRFDEDSTVGKLYFRPVRFLEQPEWKISVKQGESTASKNAVTMSVAGGDSKPKLEAPVAKPVEAVEAEAVPEPTKRAEKKAEPKAKPDLKSVMGDWSTDEEE
jgi:hypothetical protein